MSTPLETWLDKMKQITIDLESDETAPAMQAIAIIEKLKEALEKFDCIHFTDSGQSCAWGSDKAYRALAIDPEKF